MAKKIKAEKKQREDGSFNYYYYKKKVGRPKKRGPKPKSKHKKRGPKALELNEKNCLKIAKQFKTYKEFRDNAERFYRYAYRNNLMENYNWLKDDRIVIFRDKVDTVYGYFFEEQKAVYIGRTLTKRLKSRDWDHLFSNDRVAKFSKLHDTPIPKINILETDLTIEEGLEKENYYIHYYKDLGYEIINRNKTGVGCGSIGSLGKGMWNEKTCYKEAKKYKLLRDFELKASGAYKKARICGWISNYTWLQKNVRLSKNNDEDVCHKEALKYDNIEDFIANSRKFYQLAKRNNWLKNYPWLKHKHEKIAERITIKTKVKI